MKIPQALPVAHRAPGASFTRSALSQQGCNPFECLGAIQRCASNPDPVRCILDIAPNCIDCIPH